MQNEYGSSSDARSRTFVIGLDGVPFTLLQELIKGNHVPNMATLFANGYFGQMQVCIPEISSVSWTSFMTGTQSGNHGIYGFIDLKPKTYNLYFPNFTNVKAATLWDDLAARSKKCVAINMPSTYPAREINGVIISGFVAIDFDQSVYPTSLIPELKELGYMIDLDLPKVRTDHELLFRQLHDSLAGREKAVDLLWDRIDWDLFAIVITGTDRLMHFLWDAYENLEHPYHQDFIDYYTRVDKLVGRMYDRFSQMPGDNEAPNQFYMLSDHGFTGIKTEVYLNQWLKENGYLNFAKEPPGTIMDIGDGSKVFALDPSRLHINLKGKYPKGIVSMADADRIRDEIKNGLESLTFEGEPVVSRVYLKEELYEGPFIENAPDLVVLANHGFDLKGRVNSNHVFARSDLVGMHTQDDAFIYCSNGTAIKSIFDIKSNILDTY